MPDFVRHHMSHHECRVELMNARGIANRIEEQVNRTAAVLLRVRCGAHERPGFLSASAKKAWLDDYPDGESLEGAARRQIRRPSGKSIRILPHCGYAYLPVDSSRLLLGMLDEPRKSLGEVDHGDGDHGSGRVARH